MYIGILLPDGKHCTLTFHDHNETEGQYIKAVAALAVTAAQWHELIKAPTIPLEFGKLNIFEPSGAWHTEVFSPMLMNFQQRLTIQLDAFEVSYSTDFEYKPHVTLTYFKKPKVNPYEDLTLWIKNVSVVSNEFGTTTIKI